MDCATPLRKGSPAAETAPFVGVRNRRGKNSLRSNSLPLHPVPHPAARLSGKGPHRPRMAPIQYNNYQAGLTSLGAGKLFWFQLAILAVISTAREKSQHHERFLVAALLDI